MARVQVEQSPRVYTFEIDNQKFVIQVQYRDHKGMRPVDILMCEIEEVVDALKAMYTFEEKKPFKLPPESKP